ncbi:MAG: hypothetical protein QOH80_917, partial [Actinomycetota bacterium]|nr:hypothetical protein [Actinomycetota bacterium]
PSVTGLSVSDAQTVLEAVGLRVALSHQEAQSLSAPAGTVALTVPGTGARIYPGQTVTLVLSSGAPPPATPDPFPTEPPPSSPPPDPTPTVTIPVPTPTPTCKNPVKCPPPPPA